MRNVKNIIHLDHSYIVTTQKKIDIFDLINKLHDKEQNVDFIKKNDSYIIFLPKSSSRGVEVTEKLDCCKIKMNFLANAADYNLCNYVAHILCKKYNGILIDEAGIRRRIGKLFNEKKIMEFLNSDIEIVINMLSRGEDIEIIGPVRPFCIGKRTGEKVLALKKERYLHERSYILSKIIMDCQYPPVIFKPYHDMIGDTIKNRKIYFAQVISNNQNIVIEKVKKYFISGLQGNMRIELTIDDIVSVLPKEWVLLDDYTILAKKIEDESWAKFVSDAEKIGKMIE